MVGLVISQGVCVRGGGGVDNCFKSWKRKGTDCIASEVLVLSELASGYGCIPGNSVDLSE